MPSVWSRMSAKHHVEAMHPTRRWLHRWNSFEQAYHNGHRQAKCQIQALGHATHIEVKLHVAKDT